MGYFDSREYRAFSLEKMRKNNIFETSHMFCDLYCLEPGQSQKVHVHEDATKFYYIMEGTAQVLVGKRQRQVGPGFLALAKPGELHGVENVSDDRVVVLVAMAPNPNPNPDPNPNPSPNLDPDPTAKGSV